MQRDQTNPQVMANTLTADKPWTHMGVEHAQDLGITNLYLANTGAMGHGLEVREGMVWLWKERGSLF